jgi:hypothetical protein
LNCISGRQTTSKLFKVKVWYPKKYQQKTYEFRAPEKKPQKNIVKTISTLRVLTTGNEADNVLKNKTQRNIHP